MNRLPVHITFLVLLLLLTGCSAQKNTGISRAYHNLTARYNVLFNGNESYKKGIEKIDAGFKDDYAEILPIFMYGGKEAAALAGADMDRTIKKCSKLITLHSITAKPKVKDSKTLTPDQREFFSKKEYNIFVDDAYLLMGKAHFYKQEYELASDVFKRVVNDFKNQPTVYETQVWIARLSIETGQFINAAEILALLNNNASFPKKQLSELYTTYADYQLKQKNYSGAIEFLEKALEVEKLKKSRTRYMFILAQLFEKTGDLKRASDYYEQVIQMNPAYEMAFNAQISRALAYEQGFGKADDIESELTKMLHDDKNIEYQDQIYYALGNLEIKEGNEKKALEYYSLSIEVNKGNEQQKIRSYLTLANHYYAIPDYPNAQAYYDSAVTHIDPDYPGYNALYTKSKSLTRLVEEINTVNLADSVLVLARLPQQDLYKRIDGIIEKERKLEEQARLKQQEEQLDQQFGNEAAMRNAIRQQTTTSTSAQWYFYNDAAKNLGYREFKVKWGNRLLEDHWQRASKAMVTSMPGTGEDAVSGIAAPDNAESAFGIMSREFYLADIPFTDSAVEASLKKVELALFNMGMIYKDDLKDFDKAAESFKVMIRRFPVSANLLPAYYNLYGMAKDQNNQAMADYYKNTIASQFPESMYAKVLTNPEFFRELEKEEEAVRQYYQQTYELYQGGQYNEVIARTENALKSHPGHLLVPQFSYLGLLAASKTMDQQLFRERLLTMIQRYPSSEIAADARNLIRYMDQEHPELKEAEDVKISRQLYQPTPDLPHHFIVAIDKKINSNQLVFNIINYNLDHCDSLNLMVEIININTTQNLISVRTFKNKQQAMTYLNDVRTAEEITKDMPGMMMLPMVISVYNLKSLTEDKSVDRYMKFFNENYQ